jgi:hypothetical protein
MAGVMQSEYSLPKGQCAALVGELKRGLLLSSSIEISDGEFLLQLVDSRSGRSQPFLSFWTSSPTDENRRVDLHWVVGQEELAARVEQIVCRHGGVVTFGSVGRLT